MVVAEEAAPAAALEELDLTVAVEAAMGAVAD